MSVPLVTVVTPTLDPGPRLNRCLNSVARQTHRNIEHIVIDGGSTDGTIDVLKSTSNITWISEPDEGQSSAINKGFRIAKGDLMGWLNADDVLVPEAIERVAHEFCSDPTVGWVFGNVEVVDGGRKTVERPARIERPVTWAARNLAAQPGSFIARWALDKVGYLDESFHYMMDCDLWLRLLDAGIKSSYIPNTLAVFEVHPGSKSGSVSHAEFLKEEARARFKSGRNRTAAVAVGRAVAWTLLPTATTQPASVEEEINAVLRAIGVISVDLPDDLIVAGFRTEQAILRAKADSVRAIPSLLHPDIWLHAETRARIKQAAAREARRWASGLPDVRRFGRSR